MVVNTPINPIKQLKNANIPVSVKKKTTYQKKKQHHGILWFYLQYYS